MFVCLCTSVLPCCLHVCTCVCLLRLVLTYQAPQHRTSVTRPQGSKSSAKHIDQCVHAQARRRRLARTKDSSAPNSMAAGSLTSAATLRCIASPFGALTWLPGLLLACSFCVMLGCVAARQPYPQPECGGDCGVCAQVSQRLRGA